MKRRILLVFSTVALLTVLFALESFADTDIDPHRSCVQCGMDRKAYGYSRMLIQFDDGGQTGVCSLHCAVTELDSHKERLVTSILVADRATRLLIDADKAIWVMGGKKRGVMTQLPKWAFSTEDASRAFIGANGGSIASWAEVLAAAREEIASQAPQP